VEAWRPSEDPGASRRPTATSDDLGLILTHASIPRYEAIGHTRKLPIGTSLDPFKSKHPPTHRLPLPSLTRTHRELPYLSTPAMCHSSLPTRGRTPSRQRGHCVLSTKSRSPNDAVRVAWGKRATRASDRWREGARRGEQGGLTSLWAGGERGCRGGGPRRSEGGRRGGDEVATTRMGRQQKKGGASGVGVEAEDVSSI
jgi:hypothetical protein